MNEFGTAQQIDTDPVGAALTATHDALFELRATDRREARRLTDQLEQIAAQHSAGLLADTDTVHALAGLVQRAGHQEASPIAHDSSSPSPAYRGRGAANGRSPRRFGFGGGSIPSPRTRNAPDHMEPGTPA